MKRYLYNYQTIVTFSQPVTNHHLLLRCQPMSGSYMRIDEEQLIVSPGYRMCRDVDAFGNRVVYGGQREEHTSLAYISAGIVEMSQYVTRTDRGISPIYLIDTPLTMIDLEQSGARPCLPTAAQDRQTRLRQYAIMCIAKWLICLSPQQWKLPPRKSLGFAVACVRTMRT